MARVPQAKIEVVINDENAQKSLKELALNLRDLSKARTQALKDNDAKLFKSLDAELKVLSKEFNEATRQVFDVEQVLHNLNKVSIRDLLTAQRKLRAEMQGCSRDSDEYADKVHKLTRVEKELTASTGHAAERVTGFLGKLKNTIFTFDLSSIAYGVMNYAQKAVDAYAAYDDKLADVQKTTGLAKDSVEELSESLSKIDTRTSQNELLGLATQAGKLGRSALEDVERFSIAADKIGVSLGEDLGDKEQAINSIGKLVDIFNLKDQYEFGDAMLKVGSAVNSLGAASAANEGYIVDFLSRTGGIAVSANISSTAIMGLGATFSALNQPVEASATVMNKLIAGMFSKTSEYAKVAKMDLQSFSDLLKNDTNEAMLQVLKGMKGQDLGYTAQMLGEVGENGARAASAVALISDKIDMVRAQQALASAEFEKGTSIIDEFNTKNNTAQARREKQQKELTSSLVGLGRALQPILDLFYSGLTTVSKAVRMLIGVIAEYKGWIIAIGVATGAYVAWQKISANWSKVQAYWSGINKAAVLAETQTMAGATVATKLLAAAKMLLAGNFRAAGIAAKAFLGSLGPVGWAVIAITLLVGVSKSLNKELTTAEINAKRLSKINSEATASIITEKFELESYLRIASDKAVSDKVRAAAMEHLQGLIPNGIDLINEETIANGKAKVAVDKYCESLLLRAKLEAAKEHLVEYERAQLAAMERGDQYELTHWQSFKAVGLRMIGFIEASNNFIDRSVYEANEKFKTDMSDREDWLKNHVDELQKQMSLTNGSGRGDDVCKKCGKKPCVCKVGTPDNSKWSLENDEKYMAARVALKRQLLNGELATEDEYSKAVLGLEIASLEARVNSNKEKGKELEKLNEQLLDKKLQQTKTAKSREEKLSKEIQGGDTDLQKAKREYDEKLQALGLYGKQTEELTASEKAALLQIEKGYTQKVSAINLDTLNKNLNEGKKALERKLTALRLAQADELAAVQTLEQKKQLLARWFSAEQLQAVRTDQEANRLLKSKFAEEQENLSKQELQSLLVAFQAAAAELNAQGGLLDGVVEMTEEDRAKLQDIIDKLREEFSKLGQSPVASTNTTNKVDVFGMSVGDWSTLFQNTEGGLTALQKMEVASKAIGNAFNEVGNLMSAIEARELKTFEKNQDKKKKSLDKQLKSGQLSQESYNTKVQQLDEETDAKREEVERKQAERQKALAIFNVLVSTAVAIVKALGAGPIVGPILAGVIGALAAVQVAAIIAQPVPGAEEGGLLVERSQDGQLFNAKYEPKQRGAVSSPTVIVGEVGTEYVVPAEGYANPTVRPVLDMIEKARRSGSLRDINLTALMASNMGGRSVGGVISVQPTGTPSSDTSVPWSSDLLHRVTALLELNAEATAKLLSRLDGPIAAEVSVLGRKGIVENLEKYNSTKQRTTIQ